MKTAIYRGVVRGGRVVLVADTLLLTDGTEVLVTPVADIRGTPAAVLAAVERSPRVPSAWVDELEQLIAHGRRPPSKGRLAVKPGRIATSVVGVGEIRYGLDRLPAGKKRSDLETRAQNILAALRIEPVAEPIADTYGRLKATLESQGLNLDDNDL